MKDAIIIEGERFDWKAAHADADKYQSAGRPWAAAFCSDPGIVGCPRCHENYWAEGIRQRCPKCVAEYAVDWWSMLSCGVQHGRILADPSHPLHKFHKGPTRPSVHESNSEVFRWGAAHPDCCLDTRIVFRGTDWIAVWAGEADYEKEGHMVGGKVVGLVRGPESTLLHVEDKHAGGGKSSDFCSVRCEEVGPDGNRVEVNIGDSVWWQAGKVYWTSRRSRRTVEQEKMTDVPLKKIGYSH